MEDLLKPDEEMLSALATELGLMSIVTPPQPSKTKADTISAAQIPETPAA